MRCNINTVHIIFIVFVYLLVQSVVLYGQSEQSLPGTHGLLLNEPYIKVEDEEQNDDAPRYSYEYLRGIQTAGKLKHEYKFYESLEIYSQLHAQNKDDISVIFGIADVYFLLGDQSNAELYYNVLLRRVSVLSLNNTMLLYYRLANIAYNNGLHDEYVGYLERIVTLSKKEDVSIVSILDTQGLNSIPLFYKIPFDYSYVAYRELGYYYAFGKDDRKSIVYTLTALSMAMQKINTYLQRTSPGYKYSDIRQIFEVLRERDGTLSGIVYMEIDRILASMYRYFVRQDSDFSNTDSRYLKDMLAMLHRENVLTLNSEEYYPMLP